MNRIRQSLALIARNSSAFGLVQPHLERTKLCQLGDEALEPKYVRQRSALQQLVASLAHPKVGFDEGKEPTDRMTGRRKEPPGAYACAQLGCRNRVHARQLDRHYDRSICTQAVRGELMTGAGLASLIERMVTALNSREIPSAGSMLEFFNKEVTPNGKVVMMSYARSEVASERDSCHGVALINVCMDVAQLRAEIAAFYVIKTVLSWSPTKLELLPPALPAAACLPAAWVRRRTTQLSRCSTNLVTTCSSFFRAEKLMQLRWGSCPCRSTRQPWNRPIRQPRQPPARAGSGRSSAAAAPPVLGRCAMRLPAPSRRSTSEASAGCTIPLAFALCCQALQSPRKCAVSTKETEKCAVDQMLGGLAPCASTTEAA